MGVKENSFLLTMTTAARATCHQFLLPNSCWRLEQDNFACVHHQKPVSSCRSAWTLPVLYISMNKVVGGPERFLCPDKALKYFFTDTEGQSRHKKCLFLSCKSKCQGHHKGNSSRVSKPLLQTVVSMPNYPLLYLVTAESTRFEPWLQA